MHKPIVYPDILIRGMARVPGARKQKIFFALTNKNCRVWSEK